MPAYESFEVEQKYRVATHGDLLDKLIKLGTVQPTERHCDTYLQHPSRDFAQSGEAFRIRELNGRFLVTYKGPRLPGSVKIRQEIELPLAENTGEGWIKILQALGFRVVAQVNKSRQPLIIDQGDRQLNVTLDSVAGLGAFVEIEGLAKDKTDIVATEMSIHALARELGLSEIEPRSYLRQLLDMNAKLEGSETS
jgi:adenylate cyclase, class 2